MPPKGSTKRKRVADESTNMSVVSGSGGSLGHRVQRSPDDLVKVLEMLGHQSLLEIRLPTKGGSVRCLIQDKERDGGDLESTISEVVSALDAISQADANPDSPGETPPVQLGNDVNTVLYALKSFLRGPMGLLTKEDASDMGDLYMLHRHLTSIDLFTSAARLKDEHLEDLNGLQDTDVVRVQQGAVRDEQPITLGRIQPRLHVQREPIPTPRAVTFGA